MKLKNKKEVTSELNVSLGTINNWIKQSEFPKIKQLESLIVGVTLKLTKS